MAFPAQSLLTRFRERFGGEARPRLFRAPGRVNLIGEHTDYSDGFVLPIALESACWIAAAPNGGGTLRIVSENNGESAEAAVADLGSVRPAGAWHDYVVGVAVELHKIGLPPQPLDLLIHSTVPVGAGLSSSAALEVSAALALLHGRDLDKVELARLARRAENNFVGMPCGIMDQFIAVFGEENAALLIDCRSLDHTAAPLPEGASIIAVNSMVKHELGASAYRVRVQECKDAVEAIQRRHPEVRSLRDVESRWLPELESTMPENVYRRARHVTTEDERVQDFIARAGRGDLAGMGRLFVGSHRSLQHDYEVSCEELDFLVDTAVALPGVFGARMTGGGFGGCTVNLVAPDAVAGFESAVRTAYQGRFGIEPKFFECRPSAGAGEVKA
ncbi:MAG TPA: galactokinase [Solibacterales bacterium]|nr:galactokinase [Bryobacterales bacterium]